MSFHDAVAGLVPDLPGGGQQQQISDTPTHADQLREASWYTNLDNPVRRVVTNSFPGGVITQEAEFDEQGEFQIDYSTTQAEDPATVIFREGQANVEGPGLFPGGTWERYQAVQEGRELPEFDFETEPGDLPGVPDTTGLGFLAKAIAGFLALLLLLYAAGQLVTVNV